MTDLKSQTKLLLSINATHLSVGADEKFIVASGPNGLAALSTGPSYEQTASEISPSSLSNYSHAECCPHINLCDNIAQISNNCINLWQLEGSRITLKSSLISHTKPVKCFCWSPFHQNLLLSTSLDKSLRIWDIRDQRSALVIHNPYVIDHVNWHHRMDHLFLSTRNGNILLWDSRKPLIPIHKWQAHSSRINSIKWPYNYRDCSFITAGNDGVVNKWMIESETPKLMSTISFSRPIWRAKFLSNPEYLIFTHSMYHESDPSCFRILDVSRHEQISLMGTISMNECVSAFSFTNLKGAASKIFYLSTSRNLECLSVNTFLSSVNHSYEDVVNKSISYESLLTCNDEIPKFYNLGHLIHLFDLTGKEFVKTPRPIHEIESKMIINPSQASLVYEEMLLHSSLPSKSSKFLDPKISHINSLMDEDFTKLRLQNRYWISASSVRQSFRTGEETFESIYNCVDELVASTQFLNISSLDPENHSFNVECLKKPQTQDYICIVHIICRHTPESSITICYTPEFSIQYSSPGNEQIVREFVGSMRKLVGLRECSSVGKLLQGCLFRLLILRKLCFPTDTEIMEDRSNSLKVWPRNRFDDFYEVINTDISHCKASFSPSGSLIYFQNFTNKSNSDCTIESTKQSRELSKQTLFSSCSVSAYYFYDLQLMSKEEVDDLKFLLDMDGETTILKDSGVGSNFCKYMMRSANVIMSQFGSQKSENSSHHSPKNVVLTPLLSCFLLKMFDQCHKYRDIFTSGRFLYVWLKLHTEDIIPGFSRPFQFPKRFVFVLKVYLNYLQNSNRIMEYVQAQKVLDRYLERSSTPHRTTPRSCINNDENKLLFETRCDDQIRMTCFVCDTPVKGLCTIFSSCMHGGHPAHVESWCKLNGYGCPICDCIHVNL